MSTKLVNHTNLFKKLTGIVGIVGVSCVLGLPALSQSNTTPRDSSSTTANEVCIIPSRTISSNGSVDMRGNMGGMAGDMQDSNRTTESGAAVAQDSNGIIGGQTAGPQGTASSTGGGSSEAQGTARSMGEATGSMGASANRQETTANRQATTGNMGNSAMMQTGTIVCGVQTTPDGTTRPMTR